jgi:hypothetical protein
MVTQGGNLEPMLPGSEKQALPLGRFNGDAVDGEAYFFPQGVKGLVGDFPNHVVLLSS